MTLTQALNTAQAIFNNTGKQSAVVSNNIANSSNADYTRRQAMTTISADGATVVQIARSAEPSLQRQLLASTSADAAQQRLLTGLGDIQSTIGGNDSETAPSTYLANFREALQAYAAAPNSNTTAQAAVTAAQDVANSLNQSTASVQTIRTNADKEIATTVGTLNSLLGQFQTANDAVKTATGSGADASNALDQRDAVLKQISSIVGVKTVNRANGDMALYTSDGATLFETLPRAVTFTPTNGYSASSTGNSVYIDGVALAPGSGANTTAKGTLQALLQIRDVEAPTYQKQLDEIGRGLVTMFSETNTTDGSKLPGLFTYTDSGGNPGDTPTSATVIDGMAASITVNPAVITSADGNPNLLRDGGINGTDYVNNTSGDAGYSTQLDAYDTAMGTAIDFDPSAGVDSNSSIMDFASNSVGWVESERSAASTAAENTAASSSRSTEAYSNGTGVNLDEELTLMMDIEQSYKAGTKILSAVNDMLTALLQLN
ncbi:MULTISPECIES: flagellar hook-associated protein FlgK [unclassified Rhizobium]|uniref:flagellar hook-associated protein FlgK n=1 Tax=unclassified Rhizobium TaxID=2613769 RepID=UPI001ADA1726|nr:MULTISPECIES: flagellar hook-associated protein FlgK [unclassified Rhizobium]MBO9097293.1 flagellar hook-associated protein FlgK [Rhizobium sp. L58/93]MBO9133855.1 flagellar hook-associated protein FlgK [Rhizobium sp. B209b/85]MBO9167532.1 flagellar hook-associated protein FlgK [Rhizobium sp. L245/93]MBO9183491.1 flagellar hook-associated protein FlgK [Rhizobium sp. E27B/91]QXZ83822.1 flagellar hook-associated protein FlgK [Rhizobium sp. K1/93]